MNLCLSNFRLSACALACASLVAACGGGDANPPPDTLAPTLSISSNATGTVKGDVTYTFTFSEDIGTSFTADDVTVTGGTKAATLTKVNATSYTLIVTPTANTTGSLAVSVGTSKFSDAANNGNTATASAPAVAFDTQAPTVLIGSSVTGTATGPVILTFTFSEDVGTSFTVDDVTLTGGSKAASVTKVSATVYTLEVTPNSNSSGNLEVSVASGAVSDVAGNGTTAPVVISQPYSTVLVTPLVFASAYTNQDVDTITYARAGRSVEGGSFNWYQDAAANDWSNFWWNGISPVTDTPPSFYFGLGFASTTGVPFIGAFVNAANDTSVTLSGQKQMQIAVWGNDELTSRKVPTFTVFAQLKQSFNGCYVEAKAPVVTPLGTGAQTYTIKLADFTIKNNCDNSGVTTVADFFSKPIGSVHVQILKEHMFFNGTATSPNGINLGPISFLP
ncbi:MAG: hypothetical protein RIS90_899 [Pseudomonadota bacterium]|jgi:hypothetical protein